MSPHRVVIVGGGFGGLGATRGLRRADVEIVLIDRRNFHLFQPLSYQVRVAAARGSSRTRRTLRLPDVLECDRDRARPHRFRHAP